MWNDLSILSSPRRCVCEYVCVRLQYAAALANFVEDQRQNQLRVWTGLARDAIDTTVYVSNSVPQEHWKALNELDAVSLLVLLIN